MIKSWIANTAARKTCVFALVFVIAGALFATQLAQTPDAITAQNYGFGVGSHMSMPIDGQTVTPSALADSGFALLRDLIQPLSTNTDTPDIVIYGNDGVSSGMISSELGEADIKVYPGKPAPRTEPYTKAAELQDGFVYLPELPIARELQHHTWLKCHEQNLDYTLVLALMWRESRFETQAVNLNHNGTHDSGIMQINDVNRAWLHKELSIDDLMDPYQNINAGTEILGRFTEKYGERNALLAYQYGETGMQRKLRDDSNSSKQITQLYQKQAEYQAMLNAVSSFEKETGIKRIR